MALPRRLIDNGFLYEMLDKNAPHHALARQVLKAKSAQYFIPDVALTEAIYLVRKAGDIKAAIQFMDALIRFPKALIPINDADLPRIREIMLIHAAAKFDFVDCCIMALSERLNITTLCPFDRRDFSQFRPSHTTHLELLPEIVPQLSQG
jgi:predicted nucleic acid-binding protein